MLSQACWQPHALRWRRIVRQLPAEPSETILTAMKTELDRSMAALSKGDPPVYFISYTLSDRQYSSVSRLQRRAAFEQRRPRALAGSADAHRQLPTGRHTQASRPPAELDQSRHVRGCSMTIFRCCAGKSGAKPTGNIAPPSEALIKVKTSQQVQVQTAEGAAPDFSQENRRTPMLARAWKFMWTASRGKSVCGDTPRRSANRRTC